MGIVRDVPPTTLKGLWGRRNTVVEAIDLTKKRIVKFKQCVIENERHLSECIEELSILNRGIKKLEEDRNGE